jgi:uncharacterized protein YndB with AHSA1/START domain
LPRYAASRTLLAPLEDVWRFLAELSNLSAWWPGIAEVRPDRRGLAPGARWHVVGPNQPSYLRRPQMNGTLLVLEVAPLERIAFQLTDDRIDVEIELHAPEADRTDVTLTVAFPWLAGVRRSFPHRALSRLHAVVRTEVDETG